MPLFDDLGYRIAGYIRDKIQEMEKFLGCSTEIPSLWEKRHTTFSGTMEDGVDKIVSHSIFICMARESTKQSPDFCAYKIV